MEREQLSPQGVHTPQANYSHVARVGDTLYVSGQIPLDRDGNLVGRNDPEAQAEQCLRNVEAIVRHFGGGLADVVKITTYITNWNFRPLVSRPRDRMFSAPYPASTLVVVSGLASPEFLVEIEAIAALD